jgi:hypothetical protein
MDIDDLMARLQKVKAARVMGIQGLEEEETRLSARIRDAFLGRPTTLAEEVRPLTEVNCHPATDWPWGSPNFPPSVEPPVPPLAALVDPVRPASQLALVAQPRVTVTRLQPPPTTQPRKNNSDPQQLSMTSFFSSSTTSFVRGKPVLRVDQEAKRKVVLTTSRMHKCSKCGRDCGNQGGLIRHEKTCDPTAERKENKKSAAPDAKEDDDEDEDDEDDGAPPLKVPRTTKAGLLDRRSRNSGAAQRQRYTIMFKATCMDKVQALKDDEDMLPFKAATVVARSYGLNRDLVFKWSKKKDKILEAVMSDKHAVGFYKGARVLKASRAGRRMCLGSGWMCKYALAEKATYDDFKEKRSRGLRIGPRMLSLIMRKKVAEIYGKSAPFKGGKPWRQRFAKRWSISLRKKSNKKPISAAERLPKVKRWFARFRRRLRRGSAAKKAITERAKKATAECRAALIATRHGNNRDKMVALQGSHGMADDCGLCALKNITGNPGISKAETLVLARKFEAELDETDSAPNQVHHLDATGNFSGRVLEAVAAANDYGTYRLSKETFGECGDARALVETLCILLKSRVCGVVWREGSAVDGTATSSWGHWLGASYLPNLGDWRSHNWALKDSLDSNVHIGSTEQLLERLDEVERKRFDFFVVVDLA